MRKFIGWVVALFPFILLISFVVYLDWVFSVLIFCGVILVVDIVGWMMWFWEVGNRIMGDD